jgi:hypothetical protein
MNRKRQVMNLLTIVIFPFTILVADVPQLINYQGMLTDASGTPMEGIVAIQFLIYDEKEGGALLWQERQNVIVSNGIFHVLLGTVTLIPYSVFNGDDRYFTIQIGDEAELQPRQRLVSVAYAFRSHVADSLAGIPGANIIQSVNNVYPGGGNLQLVEGTNIAIEADPDNNAVIISATGSGSGGGELTLPYTGTTATIQTAFSLTTTGTGRAVNFKISNEANDNAVLYGETTGRGRVGHFRIVNVDNANASVSASTTGSGAAISGYTTGSGAGVHGRTDGSGHAARFEITNAANANDALYVTTNGTGLGIFVSSVSSTGIRAQSLSNTGSGVHGICNGENGTGLLGVSNGINGKGVWGNGTGANSYGVYGRTTTENGTAVYGWNEFTGAIGSLAGLKDGVAGVYGYGGLSGAGVRAESGIFGSDGQATTSAVLAGGDIAVWGTTADLYGSLADRNWGAAVVGRASGVAIRAISSHGTGISSRGKELGVYAHGEDGTAVYADGDLVVTGALLSPFPRPAYDSGWQYLSTGSSRILNHGIGGNVDNYVVDVQFKNADGINIHRIGYDMWTIEEKGASWGGLTNESIRIGRASADNDAPWIRIRIWVYN